MNERSFIDVKKPLEAKPRGVEIVNKIPSLSVLTDLIIFTPGD